MQRKRESRSGEANGEAIAAAVSTHTDTQRGCYGVQILIAGRRKHWRDQISAQVRRAGFSATTVDSAVDALTILVLGLPIDVLVTDADLHGELGCSRLATEARALRPNLGIVFATDVEGDQAEHMPDALVIPPDARDGAFARTVREALSARV